MFPLSEDFLTRAGPPTNTSHVHDTDSITICLPQPHDPHSPHHAPAAQLSHNWTHHIFLPHNMHYACTTPTRTSPTPSHTPCMRPTHSIMPATAMESHLAGAGEPKAASRK